MRPRFLLLTPVCVFLGLALAVSDGQGVNALDLALIVAAALGAHISVNALNEYQDFDSGLDFQTPRTPFSGGSGALVAEPACAPGALLLGQLALLVSVLAGLLLVYRHGWQLLPLGLLGVALVASYTPWLNRFPVLCLLAPGLGFGTLMVLGSYFVLRGHFSWTAIWVSLLPFLLVNNLLLLNQLPDRFADAQAGRRHLVVVRGVSAATRVYSLFSVLAWLVIGIAVWRAWLPGAGLLGLLTAPLMVWVMYTLPRQLQRNGNLVPCLAVNVVICLLTPVLLGIGLLLG
ncbi:MAG TPA: prenyltransferase [Spongiibacteraceae bacterium]|nr:prenyltransferase [Spongiibacteraceae bacterium]HUH36813.1 prenyltransferase [Spongiibacteraceae bacterium]